MTTTPEPDSAPEIPVVPVQGGRGHGAARIGAPLVIALILIAGVWIGGAIWSFAEQTAFAHFKHFQIPQLLPLVIDGFAVAMAAVAWAASLDGRAAVLARVGTALAVAGSAGSNAAWAWERSAGDVGTVALAVAVPVAANLAFEVLLSEIRKQVQRRRGMPAPVAVPLPRMVRLMLSPWATYFQWRRLVLELTDMRTMFAAAGGSKVIVREVAPSPVVWIYRQPPTHPVNPPYSLSVIPLSAPGTDTAPDTARTAVTEIPAIATDTVRTPVTVETVTAPDTDDRRMTAVMTATADVDTDSGDRALTASVTEIAARNGRRMSAPMTENPVTDAVKLRPWGRPDVAAKVAKLADRNPAITAAQVASRLGMSERTARRYLTAPRPADDHGQRPGAADMSADDEERQPARINGHGHHLNPIGVSA